MGFLPECHAASNLESRRVMRTNIRAPKGRCSTESKDLDKRGRIVARCTRGLRIGYEGPKWVKCNNRGLSCVNMTTTRHSGGMAREGSVSLLTPRIRDKSGY